MDTWSGAEEAVETRTITDCPICEGAGFVHPKLPTGKPDFSQVIPCRCTKAKLEKERHARLLVYSNLGSLNRSTFDNLLPQGRSGNPLAQRQFEQITAAARAFADLPQGWLVLVGPSGCGKTHLAAAIVNERLKYHAPAFFQSVPDLLDHLRSAFKPESEMPYDELFDRVRNTPLLVLDDLGVQSSTPWAKEKLDQLLNHRFNNELPTVITSLTPPEQMEERLRTRLSDPHLSQVYIIEEKETTLPEYDWGPEFELQKSMTFKKFQKRPNLPPEIRENLEKVYHTALEFAQSPDGWLVLQGVNGCGKTHLAAAITNYRYEAGRPALFIVVPEFLDHLRSAFSPESQVTYDQLFERVKQTELLIFDDFGEQSTTPWAQEKLYQVINYRYNKNLPTVITTCFALTEIERRISSRLVDPKISVAFNIMAPDYRGDQSSQSPKTTSRRSKRGGWD